MVVLVSFYRLNRAQMPWGDYGSILASGMSAHLGRKDELIQLERTGPFIPPVTFPGIGDIVVTSALRDEMIASGLGGFSFKPVLKVRVVELKWHEWDRTAPEPFAYPIGGEPENYILDKPHSPAMADALGSLWELLPGAGGIARRRKTGPKRRDFEIILKPSGDCDFFRAEGGRYNFVTERAKQWLQARVSDWVSFQEVVVE